MEGSRDESRMIKRDLARILRQMCCRRIREEAARWNFPSATGVKAWFPELKLQLRPEEKGSPVRRLRSTAVTRMQTSLPLKLG